MNSASGLLTNKIEKQISENKKNHEFIKDYITNLRKHGEPKLVNITSNPTSSNMENGEFTLDYQRTHQVNILNPDI